MKAVLIMGSTFDEPHAKKITDKLDEFGISWEQFAASAHKPVSYTHLTLPTTPYV